MGGGNTVFGYDSYAALYFLGKRLGFGYMVALGIRSTVKKAFAEFRPA